MAHYYLICTYILAGVLGLCVGSFLNVLIWRLPRGENIAKPASHCPKCGYVLKWYDNIPVLSYCLLRGRCRNCGERISFRYTAVEILNCLLWLACVWRFYACGIGAVIACCVAVSALIVCFFCDIETMTIPDSMIIGIALSGLALLILEIFGLGTGISWQDRLWGMGLGLAFFAFFFFFYLVVKRKEALGFGDVKLMGAVGLLVGWQGAILCTILACLGVFVWLLVRLLRRRGGVQAEQGEFPFAPFLAAGALVALFFGDAIISFYLSLFV